MRVTNKKTGKELSGLFLKLVKKEITNVEFEELTGLEPSEKNPSRKDWLKRNKEDK